jgi:phosphoribosylanthranilate isomerase
VRRGFGRPAEPPTVKVKICGATRVADALAIAAAGADYLGLNLWPGSKRYLPPPDAEALAQAVRSAAPGLALVGVFVNAGFAEIAAATKALGLVAVQLHGDEDPDACARVAAVTGAAVWKAIAVREHADVAAEALARWPVDAVLLDAPSAGRGGAGVGFDHALARVAVVENPRARVVLAGGLAPETVAAAVAAVGPWAVDVASGVEAHPGIKDHARVAAFVAAARSV